MSKWAATYLMKRASVMPTPPGVLESIGRFGNRAAGEGLDILSILPRILGAKGVAKGMVNKGNELRAIAPAVNAAREGVKGNMMQFDRYGDLENRELRRHMNGFGKATNDVTDGYNNARAYSKLGYGHLVDAEAGTEVADKGSKSLRNSGLATLGAGGAAAAGVAVPLAVGTSKKKDGEKKEPKEESKKEASAGGG